LFKIVRVHTFPPVQSFISLIIYLLIFTQIFKERVKIRVEK